MSFVYRRIIMPLDYWFWRNLFWLLLKVFFRVSVVGKENIPRKGPLIVVSNHLAAADPPIMAYAVNRRIRFMAKVEMLYGHWYSPFLRWGGVFPVRRFEADLGALRKAKQILREGEVLGMFPEGTRSRTGGMGPGHPGTAVIALQSGAPVLPIAITGSESIKNISSFFHRYPINITVGEPIVFPATERVNYQTVKQATDVIMGRIAELLPPAYRGVYADVSQARTGG